MEHQGRTCNKCGRVHFGVTRAHAEADVKSFNAYFDGLPVRKQQKYYGGRHSTIASYERCMMCGNSYTNFRPEQPGDCPDGCTQSPIIA